jgi:serine/threonine protein kinase
VLIEHSGSMDALSVEYAAPEQFDPSQFGDQSESTDIYQLGVIVYILLTEIPRYTGNQSSISDS